MGVGDVMAEETLFLQTKVSGLYFICKKKKKSNMNIFDIYLSKQINAN